MDTDSLRITNLPYDFTMRRVRLYPLTNHSRGHGRSGGRTVQLRAAHGKRKEVRWHWEKCRDGEHAVPTEWVSASITFWLCCLSQMRMHSSLLFDNGGWRMCVMSCTLMYAAGALQVRAYVRACVPALAAHQHYLHAPFRTNHHHPPIPRACLSQMPLPSERHSRGRQSRTRKLGCCEMG